MKRKTEPYNELPLLPPKLTLTEDVYKRTISANKLLAELKGAAGIIPNQAKASQN